MEGGKRDEVNGGWIVKKKVGEVRMIDGRCVRRSVVER
jgi:hypothetical protein